MIDTLTGITVSFDDQIKLALETAIANLADPRLRSIFEPTLGLMTTTGNAVLKAASRLALELRWPEDVSLLSRAKIDIQIKDQMQKQLVDMLLTQSAALIRFQLQTIELVVPLIIGEVAAGANRGASDRNH